MIQWEYLRVQIDGAVCYFFDGSGVLKTLDELGAEGWELVTILWHPEVSWNMAYFKRQPVSELPYR